ncbi:hypothetical protein F4779DRAFT_565692 [Xylariaceae sp. FL0662B]|nr:hypothetical protein F4779DRAFT_565692 [Xylariaceae sp. FL0662B]
MAVFNPIQLFIFPFVFLVTLPLAICAGFTTILAFLVLFLRLFLAYLDVGLETLRYVLLGNATRNPYIASQRITPTTSLGSSPPSSPDMRNRRRRKRRGRAGSGSLTPIGGLDGLNLTPSIGFERDFEGVGGWRLDSIGADADTAEDQLWANLNSRLEIAHHRNHYRSRSGGPVLSGTRGVGLHATAGTRTGAHSPGEPRTSASPNSRRSRTPTGSKPRLFTKLDENEYFALLEGKLKKKAGI